VFKIYGEDYPYLFGEIRSKGYRRLRLDGDLVDLSDDLELYEAVEHDMEGVVDTVVVKPAIYKNLVVSIKLGRLGGEGFLRGRIPRPERVGDDGRIGAFYGPFACPEHHVAAGEMEPYQFAFNEPSSACPTCLGLGIYLHVHTDLLVPDKSRSIRGGAVVRE